MGQTCSAPPGTSEDLETDAGNGEVRDESGHSFVSRLAQWSPDTVGPQALEWMNRTLELLWPEMDKVAKTIVEAKITPRMQEVASQKTSSLKDMYFSHFTLGKASPKVTGLHVSSTPYGGAKVRMMIEYKSDMKVELLAMKMKVGMRNFRLFGEAAVIVRPTMEDYPGKVSGVSLYFVNRPKMEIDFTGLAEIADLGGLNKIVRNVISDMLAEKLVLPNAVTQVVGYEDVTVFPPVMGPPHPPIGALRVRLLKAEGIRSGDINWNPLTKPVEDNYVRFTVGDRAWKAEVAKLPQEHTFTVHDLMQNLAIEVWDEDTYTSDDFLGSAGEHTMAEAQALSLKTIHVRDPTCKEGEGGTLMMEVTWFNAHPFKLGSDENMIVMQVQEVRLYFKIEHKIAVRARLCGEERMTRASKLMQSALRNKTVTSVIEDMQERLRKEGLKEEDVQRLTTTEGLRSSSSSSRVPIHSNLSFAVETNEMSSAAVEIEIVEVMPKKQERVLGSFKRTLEVFLATPEKEVGGGEDEVMEIPCEEGKIELSASLFCCALEPGVPPEGGKFHKEEVATVLEQQESGKLENSQSSRSNGKWKFPMPFSKSGNKLS